MKAVPIQQFAPKNASESVGFTQDQWYVAGFSWELKDKPVARTLLSQPLVFFRDKEGKASALEDRCCHRALSLSLGTLEDGAIRCGYHGLLFNGQGQCQEIPGLESTWSSASASIPCG